MSTFRKYLSVPSPKGQVVQAWPLKMAPIGSSYPISNYKAGIVSPETSVQNLLSLRNNQENGIIHFPFPMYSFHTQLPSNVSRHFNITTAPNMDESIPHNYPHFTKFENPLQCSQSPITSPYPGTY